LVLRSQRLGADRKVVALCSNSERGQGERGLQTRRLVVPLLPAPTRSLDGGGGGVGDRVLRVTQLGGLVVVSGKGGGVGVGFGVRGGCVELG